MMLNSAVKSDGRIKKFTQFLSLQRDPLTETRKMYSANGKINHMIVRGNLSAYCLLGPDANQLVLQNSDKIFSSKKAWDYIIGTLFKNGLMLRDGDDHRYHRRIMQIAFKKDALVSYNDRMSDSIKDKLNSWGSSQTLYAYPALKSLTLDLACDCFLGLQLGKDTKAINKAFENAVAASMSVLRVPLPGFLYASGLRGRQFLVHYFESLVAKKRELGGTDIFAHLCQATTESGESYSDTEIVDHLIFLMMAAHDTTTSTLTSLIFALAKNPEYQEALRQECFKLNKDYLDFGDKIPAIELAIKESLRLYPPLPIYPRYNEAAFDYQGVTIPENSMIMVFPIHTHYMEELWSEPFSFKPERFSAEQAEHKKHPFQWVPFGGGAHMCIGLHFAEMQIAAILFQLVKKFSWKVAEGYDMPIKRAPISKPKDKLPIQLCPL